jgi:Flp pilus assembly protein TadD
MDHGKERGNASTLHAAASCAAKRKRGYLRVMNDPIARHAKLVMQHPENELARFSLGKALFDAGQFAEAKEQFQFALTKKPDWMVVQILMGKCELSLGYREAARQALRRARDLAREQNHEGPLAEVEEILSQL